MDTTKMSFEDIMQESFSKCETMDEKFNKLVDIFCHQTKLLDIIISSLSPMLQKEILIKAGFKELVSN